MNRESTPAQPPSEDPHDKAAREWLENVYQGDTVRQLSVRSIISGMLIGGVMSISNLYVGLKSGWGLGVTITSCIIAYAVFKALEQVVPAYRRQPFTILENYTMSSAASAAGYMSSSGLVSAIPALTIATGGDFKLEWWEIMAWLAAISFLGVFMAIPLKRQLINIDQLPFPSGIATAETLNSLHTAGDEAMHKAKALGLAALVGAGLKFWREGLALVCDWLTSKAAGFATIGEHLKELVFDEKLPLLPTPYFKELLKNLTIGFEGSLILTAAGAIMGIRVGCSLLLGAVIYYGIIGSYLVEHKITGGGYGGSGINSWTLWAATSMMVASGLVAFALRWRTVLRAFSGITSMLGGRERIADPLERVEVPNSWFVIGTLVTGTACIVLGHWRFHIAWWMGILAVLLTFVLSIVAARATGETDVTPIGALGKITQLTYGAIAPTNIVTNLMTASITSGVAAHSADLLTDLKSGYLLGGNPRKQTISQLFGVLAGTLFCVPVYMVIVKPGDLGSDALPAPAATVWASVAKVLAKGLDALPQGALHGLWIGALVGIALTLAEELAPARYRKWIPSTTGLGIAGVVPAYNSIAMFTGALIAWSLAKIVPKVDAKYTIAVASGLIAGESLMGAGIALWIAAPGLIGELWKAIGG